MSFARSNPFVLGYSLLHMIGLAQDCRVCFVSSQLQVKPVRQCGQQKAQKWPTDDFTCRLHCRPADCHSQLP